MQTIWVKFEKKGMHRYMDAATNEGLKDVSYLGHPHRHKFYFKVWIEVFHDDREIEFHQFLNWLESLYADDILDADFASCEMLADKLAGQIKNKYPNRYIKISVAEDNENGSEIDYPAG